MGAARAGERGREGLQARPPRSADHHMSELIAAKYAAVDTTVSSRIRNQQRYQSGVIMRTQTTLATSPAAYGIDSEFANEAELDLYFCDLSPVEHAPLLAMVDASVDPESISLLLQRVWHSQTVVASPIGLATH
jgi:hypothetical protein